VDRSLGKGLALALIGAGEQAIAHDQRFPPDAPDVVWLAEAGRQHWIVLTKDKRIRYRELEREALIRGGLAAFVLTSSGLRGEEIAALVLEHLSRIKHLAAFQPRPFVASVNKSGVQVFPFSVRK